MTKPIEAYQAMTSFLKKGQVIDPEITTLIRSGYIDSIRELSKLKTVELTSKISEKSYFSFSRDSKISRAINNELWQPNKGDWDRFAKCLSARNFESMSPGDITKTLYSVVISFCAWCDLYGDPRKVPGTYFERFVANLIGRVLTVNPKHHLHVLEFDGVDTSLPTDLIFDLGKGSPKYHVPVKTSTRERAIQVWAHQRVIDGVFGMARVLGTPVLMAETKTDSKKLEVVEICTPMQWQLFQSHISQLQRIYYLDVPAKYAELNAAAIKVEVLPFGQFFREFQDLL